MLYSLWEEVNRFAHEELKARDLGGPVLDELPPQWTKRKSLMFARLDPEQATTCEFGTPSWVEIPDRIKERRARRERGGDGLREGVCKS
jgi:hypothetical protein